MCDETDSKSMNKEAGNWSKNRSKPLNKAKPIESINRDNLSFSDKYHVPNKVPPSQELLSHSYEPKYIFFQSLED